MRPPVIRLMGVLLLMWPVAGGSPRPAAAQPAPLDGLDEYITGAMEAWRVPGLGLAVVKDDSVLYATGYGVREVGSDTPVDEHTLFAIGSSSKAFTAATVGLLVDEGRLSWDDPVEEHLPELHLRDPFASRELTVRDLVTHRSGLPRCDFLWYGTAYSREEILRRVRWCEPERSFRSRFGYQNIMFLAAGQLVEAVSGRSWGDVVDRRLFTPLGMDRSVTSVDPLPGMENVASPHEEVDGEVVAVPWRDLDNIGPAGSINSSARQMAEWVRLHLAGGVHEGERILSDSVVAEMQRPQTIIRKEGNWARLSPEGHFLSYGMGWFLHDYRGRKVVEHGGAIDGMRAQVGMIPEEGVGVVVLTNKGGLALGNAIMFRLFDAFLGAEERDWAAEYLAVADSLEREAEKRRTELEAARVEGTGASLELEEYAGTYRDSLYGEATVTLEDGGLVFRYGTAFEGDLEHWHYDTFRATWRAAPLGKALITFVVGPRARVTEVQVQELGEFRAVPEPSEEETNGQEGSDG